MNKIIVTSLVIIGLTATSSCHLFKRQIIHNPEDTVKVTETNNPEFKTTPTMLLIDSLKNLQPNPQYVNYHFKGKLTGPDADMPINGIVGINKDTAVWVSARPGLGIEIGRIYFFRDSMFILDRVQSQYFAYDYNQLQRQMKQPINYYTFESLFSGKIFTIDEPNEPSAYRYTHIKHSLLIALNRKLTGRKEHREMISYDGKLLSNEITDGNGKQLFIANFRYLNNETPYFPSKVDAVVNTGDKTEFTFKVYKYSEDKKTVPQLKIPKYYKRAYLKL